MSDPLSISSSIVAFVDAAAEFKETISKVNVSKGKLYHLKTDVERGLSDIEQFCCFRHAELNKSEALELKSALDEMRCGSVLSSYVALTMCSVEILLELMHPLKHILPSRRKYYTTLSQAL